VSIEKHQSGFPEFIRGFSRSLLEKSIEVLLIAESSPLGNLGDSQIRCLQHFRGMVNSHLVDSLYANEDGVLFPIFQQEAFSFQCMMEKKMFICHPDICRFSDCWSIIVIPCIIKNNIVQ